MIVNTVVLRLGIVLGFLALAIIFTLTLRGQFGELIGLVRRSSPWQRGLLAVFAAALVLYGGDKNDATNPLPVPPLRMNSYPGAVDAGSGQELWQIPSSLPQLAPPDGYVATNLEFFAFCAGTNVEFGLTWPPEDPPGLYYLDLYCNWELGGGPWVLVDCLEVNWGATFLVGELRWPELVADAITSGDFPTNANCRSCFLTAAWEVDTDEDGLSDGDEIYIYRTDPNDPDMDGDGYDDGVETLLGTNPRNPDSDGDGMSDSWEWDYGFDPLVWNDADLDTDEDGLTDREECRCGTDPWEEDTDGDGFSDELEVRLGMDPLSEGGEEGSAGDFDRDGLTNVAELGLGLDPFNPDTDGDGLVDSKDPHPLTSDGDFFGPRQTLPAGANANAYYWIDLVAETNAYVIFTGDRASNLPDPDFMACAGVTNRVQLLIGKTYSVEGTCPFEIVAQSDGAVIVTNIGPNSLAVVWPVSVTVAEGRAPEVRPLFGATWNDGGETTFHVLLDPGWLIGSFVWTNACCSVRGDGTNFTYACGNACQCEGCTARGNFWYEGYALPVWGTECGCRYVPDEGPAGVTVSFSKSALIYEDPYVNTNGVVVTPAVPNATLSCTVRGGTYGGTLTVELNDAGRRKLTRIRGSSLPNGVHVDPGEARTYATVYEPRGPSDAIGDITATATFVEDFLNETHDTTASLTAVKVELEAVYDAPENHNINRHIYGVGEKVRFKVTPQSSQIRLKTVKHDTGDYDGDYELFEGGVDEIDAGAEREYTCPISANYVPPIRVKLGTTFYCPSIAIVEPQTVITPTAFWGENAVDMFYQGNRKCWPSGTVGSAALVTTNYIGPMYVSFQGIAVSEVPCLIEDVVTGCFTNGHYRTHTKQAGAGRAYYVQEGNFWFVDGARSGAAELNWAAESTLSWLIPIGWHRKDLRYTDEYGVETFDFEACWDENSRPLLLGGSIDTYKQMRHIDNEGVYRTEKFGHWITRSPLCRIVLDGVTQQERHGE